MNMKKGAVALLTIAPECAFGSSKSKQDLAVVPPNSTLYYEVEMVSFQKEKESWDMNTPEKFEAAGKKKEMHSSRPVNMLEHPRDMKSEEEKQAKALKVACNLNDAACKLKLREYKQAGKLCTKVFELDSRNVKALYQRAQAYIHPVDLDLAELDIKKALEIDPDNRCSFLWYQLGSKIGKQGVEGEGEGLQWEGRRFLWQNVRQDEQVGSSRIKEGGTQGDCTKDRGQQSIMRSCHIGCRLALVFL